MGLTGNWAAAWLRESADVLEANRERLSELDREIGDGDHGDNMARGFSAVRAALPDPGLAPTPATLFHLTAMTLISTVGGASGPLYGTAFLKASGVVGSATELGSSAVVALLTAARDGVQTRGKAQENDKTMLDAWGPAVRAAADVARAGASPREVLRAAAEAAARGSAATIPLLAHQGRASYLGERSIGHEDPGAASTALILAAAVTAAERVGEGE